MKMDVTNLPNHLRDIRCAIRGFLLTATPAELEGELKLSLERNDKFRAECIRELISES